jgi:hypothetical protein
MMAGCGAAVFAGEWKPYAAPTTHQQKRQGDTLPFFVNLEAYFLSSFFVAFFLDSFFVSFFASFFTSAFFSAGFAVCANARLVDSEKIPAIRTATSLVILFLL